MKKLLLLALLLIFLLSCSKSDSNGSISSEVNNSTTPETFGDWSPSFTDQTSNFGQTRTGTKGTKETREITVTSADDQVILSIEEVENSDINEDGDNYDITTQTTTTYTASEGLGSFSSTGEISIKHDLDIIIKNDGLVDIDIASLSSGQIKINANPSSGFEFLGWDGPSVLKPTSLNPLILDIDSDKEIKANFLNISDPNYSGIGFYADPIYSQIDPYNLLTYLDVFILDAERYGVDLSYVKEYCYNVVLVDFDFPNPPMAMTYTQCVDTQVRVVINKSSWEQAIQSIENTQQGFYKDPFIYGLQLMWHEFGHDLLHLEHTCNETPNFINSFSACEEGSNVNPQYSGSMLWFTDDSSPETSEENNGFHRAVSNYYNLINQDVSAIFRDANEFQEAIPCPVPVSARYTYITSGWKYSNDVGEDSYASDWCTSLERNTNSTSEFVGAKKNSNNILNPSDKNYAIICYDMDL
jgi:hypothetical protein